MGIDTGWDQTGTGVQQDSEEYQADQTIVLHQGMGVPPTYKGRMRTAHKIGQLKTDDKAQVRD